MSNISRAVEAYRELMVSKKIVSEYTDMLVDAIAVAQRADARFLASIHGMSDEERTEVTFRCSWGVEDCDV